MKIFRSLTDLMEKYSHLPVNCDRSVSAGKLINEQWQENNVYLLVSPLNQDDKHGENPPLTDQIVRSRQPTSKRRQPYGVCSKQHTTFHSSLNI